MEAASLEMEFLYPSNLQVQSQSFLPPQEVAAKYDVVCSEVFMKAQKNVNKERIWKRQMENVISAIQYRPPRVQAIDKRDGNKTP